jgi:hypothetical protein
VSYVDAGYAIALVVTSGFGVLLWARRRRLERLVASLAAEGAVPPAEGAAPSAHGAVPPAGGAVPSADGATLGPGERP